MNLISIWATILVLSILGSSGAAPSSAPLVKLASYHIVKKPIHIVSDKFLSFTTDPNVISHVAECSLTNATLNMAKSLTPAYFRLAGVDSNRFVFQSNPNVNHTELTSKSKIFSVSNVEWLKLNDFLSKTGMDVVACVSGQTELTNKGWDLSNTLELITFSDKNNISLDWQLGYELQRVASSQGKQMGRDVTRLRKILDVFPRYRKSLIIGPDMTSFKSQNDAIFVRNYLTEAADSLDVFTWHPFSKSSEDGEILEMLANGMNSMDTYLWIKDGLMKSSSKGVVPKKSIWIAESENTETISNLSDSMTWIMRMGAAARLGASVYLRKPHLLTFYEPTPEYWTAILYKSLVGRTVLDIKQTSGNGTNKVHMYTHCTKFIDKPDESIINPEISYDPGSITVYGVNKASESTRLSFKIGYKGDETAHLYVLTEDASGDFPKTLLNKQTLGLSSDNELPLISPRIRESPKYLLIPARSIFFVVFPNTKCRSCNEFDTPDASSKSKIKIFEEEDQDSNTFTSNILEVMEDENDHDNVYVSYPKRADNVLEIHTDSKTSSSNTLDQSNPKMNVKYVTYSEDTWLSPFPEKFKDIMNKEKEGSTDAKDKNKAEMYRILAQAMLGKRTTPSAQKELPKVENPAMRFVFEDESESNQFKRALKIPARSKRSTETVPESKLELQEDSEESIDDGNDNETLSDSALKASIDWQNIALYLFDQRDNESHAFETNQSVAFSRMNVVLLNDDNFEQAVNTTALNETIPIITFVKKSILEELFKTTNDRVKREVSLENFTIPQLPGNSTTSSNNSTPGTPSQTSPTGEQMIDELISNMMESVGKLILKYFPIDSFPDKSENITQDTINRNRAMISRMLAQAMLGKRIVPPKSENSSTRFVLEDDSTSDEFKEALKNFNTFKRSTESLESDESAESFVNGNDWTEPEQKITKREGSSSSITKSPVEMDSQDIALYLFDQQDDETRSSETHKRSTLSKIYAVPLNEDNLQMAMKSNEFKETIPIITFVKKPTLDGIVEAANDRVKRETTLENSTIPQMSDNSTVLATTPSPNNSSNQPEDNPTTQSSPFQTPLKANQSIKDPFKDIAEEVNTIIKQFSQQSYTKNQSTSTPKPNLQQANSSLPNLAIESDNSKVSRELREVEDPAHSGDNTLGTRHLKAIDKANIRPVSPFPKKPKNVKSKSAKATKSKSIDSVGSNHQSTSGTSSPSTETVISTKRSPQEVVSSSQGKSADITKNPAPFDDSEDDLTEDSVAAIKFQSAITKNFQDPVDVKQSSSEVVSSKIEEPSLEEVVSKPTILPIKPAKHQVAITMNSENVGKPQTKTSLADLAKKEQAKRAKAALQPIRKPKITPDRLRMSYEQKRKELLQKHIARLNELRSLLGIPNLSESHAHKRQANVIDDTFRETKAFLSDFWANFKEWNPKDSWISHQTEKITDMVTGRDKRHADENFTEQYSSSSKILKNNRHKRNSDIVVSPHLLNVPPKQMRELTMARIEERRRQNEKITQEKKAMKAQGKDTRIRYRRDLQQTIEKAKELKEMKQIRVNERRQNLAKRLEELKQKRSHHAPINTHRNKRDLQTIQDKIHDLTEAIQKRSNERRQNLAERLEEFKRSHNVPTNARRNKRDAETILDKIHNFREATQTRSEERRQGLSKRINELKQKISHHKPIFAHRNKRDVVPTVQDKLHDLRKKKQEHRQELHKKSQPDHPVEHPATPAPKLKTKPAKIDEPHHQVVNKTSKKTHKSAPVKQKSHHSQKREINENYLEEKATSPSDLQKDLKFHLFADPELNTPQSMLEGIQFDDLDRLRRSLIDNEIFDDDYEAGIKNKNKDHEDLSLSKLHKMNNLLEESSISTSNPLIDTKTGDSGIKLNVTDAASSQGNQTCQLTNYNVFKYLWCVAHRLWYTYFSI